MDENQPQIEYWNGRAGANWTVYQEATDLALAPLGEATLAAAAVRAGERALDVGCGCGATALVLAERVGATGHVLGVDVSLPMLGRARERLRGAANVELREADAATARFGGDRDLLFSRFGVMFFLDPTAAFANLRTALAPRGRVAFCCWRPARENPWATIPAEAIAPFVEPEPPVEGIPPGPFAFADPERVRAILGGAGFSAIELAAQDAPLRWTATPDLDVAVDLFSHIGPASRRLAEAPQEARARGLAALRAALAPHVGPTGLVLGGAVWIVTARR